VEGAETQAENAVASATALWEIEASQGEEEEYELDAEEAEEDEDRIKALRTIEGETSEEEAEYDQYEGYGLRTIDEETPEEETEYEQYEGYALSQKIADGVMAGLGGNKALAKNVISSLIQNYKQQ